MAEPLAALGARWEEIAYHRALGIRVESVETDRVRVRVPYKDENSNPGKALHGGVAASTINAGGALAAWTGFPDATGLEAGTLDLSVNYLAAAIGEDIVAEAEVLRRGKEIVFSSVRVRNDSGKAIAQGLVAYRAFDPGREPAAGERQLSRAPAGLVSDLGEAPSPSDVPELARAIVSVPFMKRLGLAIVRMKDGRAMIEMPFNPDHADMNSATHEGAVAALIDTTGAMASWSITGIDFRYKASTVGVHVNYHAAAAGEGLVAVGRTLRRNNEIFLNEVMVQSQRSKRTVATGSVTYRIVIPRED